MKRLIFKHCKAFILALAAAAVTAFPASAASVKGEITDVNSQSITGWAWNPEDTNDVQEVEIHIFQAGDSLPVKYLHVTASQYREDLVKELKDGWHGFSAAVDWSQLSGSDFKIKAYAVKDDKYYVLGDTMSYHKSSGSSSKKSASVASSPGSVSVGVGPSSSGSTSISTLSSPVVPVIPSENGTEKSLGTYSISGYCSCEECSSGWGITYSGTVPRPNHTIAADLTILPLGTKVRIGNTIYTVEDKGSSIVGHMIDIYYDDHESAAAQGRVEQEVFLIQ